MQRSFLLISLSGVTVLIWTLGLQPWLIDALQTAHPTGIPWLQTRSDCERTGRVWQDETCWDREHDPTF